MINDEDVSKDLETQAERVDYASESRRVIADRPLLEWARAHGKEPFEAQRIALEKGILPVRYLKNLLAIDLIEQQRLCAARVLICGCGGLGGVLMHLLSRSGVGCLRIVDHDLFCLSNLNRQWASDTETLARPKAVAAAEQIRSINPFVRVEAHQTSIQEHNAEALVSGTDLALDALDNIEARFLLNRWASRLGVPFIHAAIAGWWGQISTFLPGSPFSLETVYGKRRARDAAEEASGVLGPAVSVIASLQALEALRLLLGRPVAYGDRLFYFDGETGQSDIVPFG